LGFVRESLGVNYAYLPQEELGGIHRFEIFLRLGDPLEPETRRNALLRQAETLYAEKRMVRARAAVEEVLAISPKNAKARTLQKKIDSRIATSLDPETLFILGDRAFEEKRYEQAADFFQAAGGGVPILSGRTRTVGKGGGEGRGRTIARGGISFERRAPSGGAVPTRPRRTDDGAKKLDGSLDGLGKTYWPFSPTIAQRKRAFNDAGQSCMLRLWRQNARASGGRPSICIARPSQAERRLKTAPSGWPLCGLGWRPKRAALDERRQEESKGLYEKGMAAYSLKKLRKGPIVF
jgi:tetratricopeptide (TPR) repeat protein